MYNRIFFPWKILKKKFREQKVKIKSSSESDFLQFFVFKMSDDLTLKGVIPSTGCKAKKWSCWPLVISFGFFDVIFGRIWDRYFMSTTETFPHLLVGISHEMILLEKLWGRGQTMRCEWERYTTIWNKNRKHGICFLLDWLESANFSSLCRSWRTLSCLLRHAGSIKLKI